ncbi:hypothetical protein BH23PLA1_BH23PLA1_26340 [soil metagenome]
MNRSAQRNLFSDLAFGVAGSVVGLLAMRSFWKTVAPDEYRPQGKMSNENAGTHQSWRSESDPLESISVVGQQHKKEESATAAMGRIGHHWVVGEDPSDETRDQLSHGIHWGYGMTMGGVYGAGRGRVGFPDLKGGLLFGVGLWLIGDEMIVPMLGLQGGPTGATRWQHLHRLGAHLAYGAGLSAATQALMIARDRRRSLSL